MFRFIFTLAISLDLVTLIVCRCAFRVNQTGYPQHTDRQPFIISGMDQCKEYNGQLGCCDQGNNNQQVASYVQINGIFGHLGGGCDICAINLKRFWCEYACSANQSNFVSAAEEYITIPDPRKPDQTLQVQPVNISVHADTACQLFDSCKRNPFVSAVSAMSTPAGFLTFQGHNAPDDSSQYMTFTFSYNPNNSLTLSDANKQKSRKALQQCNYTTSSDKIHGFQFKQNCTCNTCELSCDNSQGFIYTQTQVFQGFDYLLVGSTWLFSILITAGITIYRSKNKRVNDESLVKNQ